jgi:hypothetical protein
LVVLVCRARLVVLGPVVVVKITPALTGCTAQPSLGKGFPMERGFHPAPPLAEG